MSKTQLHILFLLAGLTSCQSFGAPSEPAVAYEIVRDELGDLGNCTSWGAITTGAQPSPEVLALAAKRGYTRVINLRTAGEIASLPFDEAALCTELGLDYFWLPVRWSEMGDADYDRILAELERPNAGKTLLHCASGNRTAVFVALERILKDGVPYEKALEDARLAGMKPSSEEPLATQFARLEK